MSEHEQDDDQFRRFRPQKRTERPRVEDVELIRWQDLDMLPAISAAQYRTPNPLITTLVLVIGGLFAFFLIWANQAELDEVAQGEGVVIPSRKLQVVQNLEGGILEEILTTEGAVVEAGDILLRLDKTFTSATYGEVRVRYLSLLATAARLEAERTGSEIKFPQEVLDGNPIVMTNEQRLKDVREAGLRTEISTLEQRIRQKAAEAAELSSKISRLKGSARLVEQELKVTEPLVSSGAVSQIEVLRLKRTVNDLRGEIREAEIALPGAEAAEREISFLVEERRKNYETELTKDLSIAQTELASLEQTITAERDRVDRTDVRSPVRGIVQSIKIRTIGGVVQPGSDLVEIVPLDDSLLVEARVKPMDIAFIRPDLKAVVKLTAYDFSIYGGLVGNVERISATSSKDERTGEAYFSIQVRTVENHLGTADKPLPITPGMIATVDIITGKKTVMEYLLKPVLRAQGAAMRER